MKINHYRFPENTPTEDKLKESIRRQLDIIIDNAYKMRYNNIVTDILKRRLQQ